MIPIISRGWASSVLMHTRGATHPTATRIVTVILGLTPIRDRRGPSRLLDMIHGRSKKVFQTWLASQPHTWRENIKVVAMDGFAKFNSAADEELPDATAVMDPFHVVHLTGDALDDSRRHIQQELHHRRGQGTDPLYKARRMLHTRSCLLTPRQRHRIVDLFASDCHVAVEVTWKLYQNIIDAYRDPDKIRGKARMQAEIDHLSDVDVPSSLTAIITLGKCSNVDPQTSWPPSIIPTPQAAPPKPSMDASNTYADPQPGSETSPTTSPAAS